MRVSILHRAAAMAPVALLASCGEAPATAMRAAAVLGILALAAALARRRRVPQAGPAVLEVQSRTWLGRDAGIALIRARGESLLVGFGRDGVRLVTRLGRERAP